MRMVKNYKNIFIKRMTNRGIFVFKMKFAQNVYQCYSKYSSPDINQLEKDY